MNAKRHLSEKWLKVVEVDSNLWSDYVAPYG